jgi:flagellar biosynthesis anti-sigma factor FlgM
MIVPKDSHAKKPADQETAQTVKPDNEAYSVQISHAAEQAAAPLRSDDVIHDKVAAIREQLAAGTYSISGKDVANKILGALKG